MKGLLATNDTSKKKKMDDSEDKNNVEEEEIKGRFYLPKKILFPYIIAVVLKENPIYKIMMCFIDHKALQVMCKDI